MVLLEEKDNGKKFNIKKGESFRVALAENPSTGYTWLEELQLESKVLLLVKEEHMSNKYSIGSTTLHTWEYTANQIGQRTINFRYQRPWMQQSEKSFEVIINVV